jgi:hypothetical protein
MQLHINRKRAVFVGLKLQKLHIISGILSPFKQVMNNAMYIDAAIAWPANMSKNWWYLPLCGEYRYKVPNMQREFKM